MIHVLEKNKSGVEIVVQTIYSIRQPSKFYKKDGTGTSFPYTVEGTFSDPGPAWAAFHRLSKKHKTKIKEPE
jgi:hypothetical protein